MIVIASEICDNDSGVPAKQGQPTLRVEKEWKYRVDMISEIAPPLLAQPSRPVTVNRAGDVDGGFNDFSITPSSSPLFYGVVLI